MAFSNGPIEGKPRSIFINKKCQLNFRCQISTTFRVIILRILSLQFLRNILIWVILLSAKRNLLTILEEFAQRINSMKSALNNPDAFDKWLKSEEIEFKKPPIQEAMEKVSISQLSSYYARLITFYLMLYYFPSPGKVVAFIFLNKMAFWQFENK